MKLLMSFNKIILLFLFFINASYAEEIYKVEVIFIKFNEYIIKQTEKIMSREWSRTTIFRT